MKRAGRFVTLASLGALLTLCPELSWADEEPKNEPDAGEEVEEEKPSLTEEERAAIEARIRATLAEDLEKTIDERVKRAVADALARRAEQERAIAAAKDAEEEAARQAQEQAALREAEAAAEAERQGLAPAGQKRALGKHPVANDKSTYKPGSGLHLESEDGDFALTTRLRAQMRQQVLSLSTPDESELSQVFQIRRARLQFKGHSFGKHNKMKVEFAFSPRDLGVKDGVVTKTPLLTWYFEFDHLRDLTVRMGQYKIPYSRQRVVSSGDLQLVDRSLANGEFNRDRDIGLDIRSKDLFGLGGYLRYYAGVYMGEGRDFGDKNATTDFKLHYLGRLEVLPMGSFKDYKEADIERNETPKLSLGGAYAFIHDAQRLRGVLGSTPSDGGTTNYHSFNVDYAFKWAGFSSNAEFHWRKGTRTAGDIVLEDPTDPANTVAAPVTAARNGYGMHVQAGYLFPRSHIEIAARYSAVRGVGDSDPGSLVAGNVAGRTSLGDEDSVGGGVSYYIAGHPWKIQTDYFHSWVHEPATETADMFRVQLQLAY